MVVTTVQVKVKPAHIDDFIEATTANHKLSVKEPGNMRFDVLQADDDPGSFLLYEAYQTADHAAAHKQTEHYQRWRDAVAPWMAEPRSGTKYTAVCP
ncbi:MAG: antibiotic biosynthesis monooxygenase [Chitinivibrionales bacterium]|nr:antibiotic biosynthesis monooxygenase [Chitinivibrionales bacterium]